MSGISAYGVKIPVRRISSKTIRDVWMNVSEEILDKLNLKERAVTGPDEDPISLGAEAALACIKQWGRCPCELDGIVFASGTNPYATKSSASVLQDILGIKHTVFATDVQSAGRSGFDAIAIAKSMVDAGSCKNILVIASDCLNLYMSPGHCYEYAASAGAVALIISNENVIAEIKDMKFASEDKANWYRLSTERYIQLGVGFVGYISNWGLMDSIKESWGQYVAANDVTAESFMHFAVPQGNIVQAFMTCGATGADVYSAVPYVLSEYIGDMGCASVLASLCSILDVLDDAGEQICAIGYGWGDGSCVMGLETTEKIGAVENRPVVMPQIDNKVDIDYGRALKYEKKMDRNMKGLSSYY